MTNHEQSAVEPRSYSVVAICSTAGEPSAGVSAVRYDWQEGGLARMQVDDPHYPFVLHLNLNAEGLQELRIVARDDRALGRKDVRALPLPLTADLLRLGVDLNHAVQSCVEQGVPLDNGSQSVAPSTDLQAALLQVLDSLYRRQPKTRGSSERDDLRRRIVSEYKRAVLDGERAPRKVVSRRLGYSAQYVGQLLVEARRLGELESTAPGRKNRFPKDNP